MIELHLIGYTADLGRPVLELAGSDGGSYRLVVDEDLFAAVDELREQRRAAGPPVGDLVEFAPELVPGLELVPEPEPVARPPAPVPVAADTPGPSLSPAEIQARLRHGTSVRAVAREAGVDEAWIRRWEAPILAERARVRERALAARLQRPRLGSSALPLGEAVAGNLARRGVGAGELTWQVSRRRDRCWRVVVRYPWRGRKRSATWTYHPEDDAITATSDGARDLGFSRPR